MANIKFVVLFNGTSNDDKDAAVTNVVKMRDGLDEPFVVYRDGVGNDQQWTWMTRWFSQFTGWGAGWVMDHAYSEILDKLGKGIKDGKVKAGDTIQFSVSGFSRGAAIARHFGLKYINEKLTQEIQKKLGIELKVKLAAEYLFDTVPSFGLPMNLWLLEQMGIKNQEIDPGWYFDIPAGTKVFHAVSEGERRNAFTPKLVDFKEGETEEVWFDGDHSDVGGGHKPKQFLEQQSDSNPLRYMVRHALQEGLRFTETFLKAININVTKGYPLGSIHTPSHEGMPPTQIGPRHIHVKVDGEKTDKLPLIAESVLRRINEDPTYKPESVFNLEGQFRVYNEGGEIFSPANILTFSKRIGKGITGKSAAHPSRPPTRQSARIANKKR
jgi:hypothetical protein